MPWIHDNEKHEALNLFASNDCYKCFINNLKKFFRKHTFPVIALVRDLRKRMCQKLSRQNQRKEYANFLVAKDFIWKQTKKVIVPSANYTIMRIVQYILSCLPHILIHSTYNTLKTRSIFATLLRAQHNWDSFLYPEYCTLETNI